MTMNIITHTPMLMSSLQNSMVIEKAAISKGRIVNQEIAYSQPTAKPLSSISGNSD